METRTCTSCGQEKPFDRDHFRSDSKGYNGLGSQCKECFNAWQREYKAKKRGTASAPKCTRVHPIAPPVHYSAPECTEPQDTRQEEQAAPTKGPRYPAPEWKKTGIIIRSAYLESLRSMAWSRRRDVAELLDEILRRYLSPGK